MSSATSPSNRLDDQFLNGYKKLLFGQYRTLQNPVDNPKAAAEADAVLTMEERGEKLDWEDLYRLELAIVKLEPPELLRRRAWILREEYEEVASDKEIKAYRDSKPPDPDKDPEPAVRADCVHLQEELNWRYVVIWVLEEFRARLLRNVLWLSGGFLLLALAFAWPGLSNLLQFTGFRLNLTFLALVVIPGVIGGLCSTVQRLQNTKFDQNADLDLAQLDQGNASIYISPFWGGVFALLLFAIFAGDFVKGSLFPKVTFDHLWLGPHEKLEFPEVAKLFVWSFIAGFVERLVPDRLQSIAKAAESSSEPTASK